MSQVNPNWDVHDYVVLLFRAWADERDKESESYERLCDLAVKLKLPVNSEEHRIITSTKTPTDDDINRVALALGKRAAESHFKLG